MAKLSSVEHCLLLQKKKIIILNESTEEIKSVMGYFRDRKFVSECI